MAIRTTVASAVLGLLFLALVAIYLMFPQNGLVTFLCILILIVSLIVAQSRRWRDLAIMAAFAALVSLVAASIFGRARFGELGGVATPLIWGLILFGLFSWMQRNMLVVPKDRAILIANRYSGGVHVAEGPIAPPLMPVVEYELAVIPLYELIEDVHVEKINTKKQNVDLIDVRIHYRVVDSRRAMGGIPNRSQAQHEIAEKMNKKLDDARRDVAFWERLLSRQMNLEVDDIVREIIYDNVYAQNPIEVYAKREDLAEVVRERLARQVKRWGVEITWLEFERVMYNPDIAKSVYKADIRSDETTLKKLEAQREAMYIELTGEARAKVEAMRVTALVRALKESGVELSPEDLRDIVVDAIRAASDINMESTFARMADPVMPPRPVADITQDNGAKK